MNDKYIDIQRHTRIKEVLEVYPHLKEVLMQMAPAFKHLQNPILWRTVAKMATLEKVAAVGGWQPLELVNRLRKEVKQEPLKDTENSDIGEY